jgi:hypothetical protein
MKYRRAPAFEADYQRLSERERHLFKEAVQKMIEAIRRNPGRAPHWPASLRVESVADAPGVFEMTWSFTGPDGRATFDIISEGDESVLRWRRIGGHEIFREP